MLDLPEIEAPPFSSTLDLPAVDRYVFAARPFSIS